MAQKSNDQPLKLKYSITEPTVGRKLGVRPEDLKLDFNNRLHCESGPAFQITPKDLQEGEPLVPEVNYCKLYFWHGLEIPHSDYAKTAGLPEDIADRIFHNPETLTADYIDKIQNIEIRRVAIERMGFDRYMENSKYETLHTDVDALGRKRMLVRKQLEGDETITGVFVINSTPNGKSEFEKRELIPISSYAEHEQKRIVRKYEGTGSLKEVDGQLMLEQVKESGKFIPERDQNGELVYKQYFLQVHPELRPMWHTGEYDDDGDPVMQFGDAQEMTCHNAVASTFGLYGAEYQLDVES